MLVKPRGAEVVRVVRILAGVEIDDLLDAELVAIGLHQHGMRGKAEAARVQEHVIGHLAGGLQVLGEQRRRHRQRLARVVESGLIGGIDREFRCRPDIDAGEIANRVVVFGVAESPRQHHAWVAVARARFVGPGVLDPIDNLPAHTSAWSRSSSLSLTCAFHGVVS